MHERKCQLGRCAAGEYEGDATACNIYNTITKYNVDCRMNDLNAGLLFAIISP